MCHTLSFSSLQLSNIYIYLVPDLKLYEINLAELTIIIIDYTFCLKTTTSIIKFNQFTLIYHLFFITAGMHILTLLIEIFAVKIDILNLK